MTRSRKSAAGKDRRPQPFLSQTVVAILAAIVALSFLFGAIHRYAPFADDVDAIRSAGDDWLDYKLNALDILDHGLSIPRIHGAYYQPGGFLYNYFIAAVFRIFGRSSGYVYAVQTALLGVAVVLFYLAFRRDLSRRAGAAFLIALAIAMWIDMVMQWGGLLLSENLVILWIAAGMWALSEAQRRDDTPLYVIAGALFGLVFLTRQSLAFVLPVIAAVIFISNATSRRIRNAGAFLLAAAVVSLLLPFRNWEAGGAFGLAHNYAAHLPHRLSRYYLETFGYKTLFDFGIIQTDSDLGLRGFVVIKHWLILCLAAGVYVVRAAIRRRLRFNDLVSSAFIAVAFATFAFLPLLNAYGLRFQEPYIAFVLFLVFRFFQSHAADDPTTSGDSALHNRPGKRRGKNRAIAPGEA